jgi:transposase-like protein
VVRASRHGPPPGALPLYLKLRPEDQPAEGVLVCWGVRLEGRKVLLGLALGSRESYDSWLEFGRDMIGRGLRAPALVIADGAPGIWKAVRELWPAALEQRCTVHALRNVTSKLPERHHQEIKALRGSPARPGRSSSTVLAG